MRVISVDEALALLEDAVAPLAGVEIPLAEGAGRVLAAPLIARSTYPRTATAAMDGYAVTDAATRPGTVLRVIGEARAGASFANPVRPGEAVRIFTGAPMPAGTDRCIMQEYASREGDILLPAGTRLTPRAMIAAAAADRASVTVSARPSVAIIGTGDELATPGMAHLREDAIPESVTFGVAAMAEREGGRVVARMIGQDSLPALERLAGEMLQQADVVIVTGGASVGERDFAKPMFAPHGLELLFSKVALKPGKPVWLGRAKGKWVLGLPGNPTSAMVTARLFLVPLLAGLQGQCVRETLPWRTIPLAAGIPATGDRETFLRAHWGEAGLEPITNQDSGAQAALARADWLIRRPSGSSAAEAGDPVIALDF